MRRYSDLSRLRICAVRGMQPIWIWLHRVFVARAIDDPPIWSRIAIGIRRTVAAFKPHLVRPVRRRPLHEEFRIEADAAFRIGVELDHPPLDAIGIELWVDGAVQRIGEIDPPPVATRSEEHTSELQSPCNLVCRLLLEKKKQ